MIGDRVGEYDAMSSFVEWFGDVSESFLTCSIPDVECDLTTIKLDAFNFEVNTDSTQVVSLEGVLAVTN